MFHVEVVSPVRSLVVMALVEKLYLARSTASIQTFPRFLGQFLQVDFLVARQIFHELDYG